MIIFSKMVYFCSFSLGGNIDFLDFHQKKFYIIYLPRVWNLGMALVKQWAVPDYECSDNEVANNLEEE